MNLSWALVLFCLRNTDLTDYCSDSISIWLMSLVEIDLGQYEKVVERLKSEYQMAADPAI